MHSLRDMEQHGDVVHTDAPHATDNSAAQATSTDSASEALPAPSAAHSCVVVSSANTRDDAADAHLLTRKPRDGSATACLAALRVVIADDHHHVLPEIHLAIRKRVLPFTGVHVLHFDAHPDLSFPRTLDPAVIFEPQALYDALDDSVSGIAEFLMPLVYAGHVQQITWIKPHWATQMAVGAMRGAYVGTSRVTDALSVSLPLAHFIDEGAFAPASDMHDATRKQWDLFVTELPLPPTPSAPTIAAASDAVLDAAVSQLMTRRAAYVLDIDLDYFSTWNPFRRDLEQRLGRAAIDLVQRVFTGASYKDMTNGMTVSDRKRARCAFLDAFAQLERDVLVVDSASASNRALLVSTLLPLYCCSDDSSDTSDRTAALELLTAFIELLAALDNDARALVWSAGPHLDLPHHESSCNDIERMVAAFRTFLITSGCRTHRPALVTIATSTGDAFLPPRQLAFVQKHVLEALTDVFGDLATEFIEYERVDFDGEGNEADRQ